MKFRMSIVSLALLAGVGILALPAVGHTANVGYYTGCYEAGAAKAPLITQAGHTPVAVASLTAASLVSLNALVIENCNGGTLSAQINADVKTAVSNGMQLVVYDWSPGGATAAALPGAPAAAIIRSSGADINLASGSPIVTGPGGTLTNTSMDGGNSSNHGYATSIPGTAQAYLTTGSTSEIVAFAYSSGAGRVVYSAIPFDCYFGSCNEETAVGIKAYFVNVLNPGGSATTCASEGYTGTKLEWCKNICERGYTGSTLAMWIRRWTDRYRTLPYCAVK